MRLKEQRLWDSFRDAKPRDIRLQRVENGLEAGMADVVGIAQHPTNVGRVFWVELKAIEQRPKRDATPVLGKKEGLSVEQQNWHADWRWFGGRSYILIGIGRAHRRVLRLISGHEAHVVNAMTYADLSLLALATDWASIYEELRNGKGF